MIEVSPTYFLWEGATVNSNGVGRLEKMEKRGKGEKKTANVKLIYQCMRVKEFQSRLSLCNPRDCSPLGSSVHGFLQARILEWVTMPSSRGYSQPRNQTQVSLMSPALAGRFFTTSTTWEAPIYQHYCQMSSSIQKTTSAPPHQATRPGGECMAE